MTISLTPVKRTPLFGRPHYLERAAPPTRPTYIDKTGVKLEPLWDISGRYPCLDAMCPASSNDLHPCLIAFAGEIRYSYQRLIAVTYVSNYKHLSGGNIWALVLLLWRVRSDCIYRCQTIPYRWAGPLSLV